MLGARSRTHNARPYIIGNYIRQVIINMQSHQLLKAGAELLTGVTVCFLAYNEAKNLRILLPVAHKVLSGIGENYEIMVVDTSEPTDDTCAVCAEFEARYMPQELPGFGGAFKTGVKYARFDKYLTTDSDGSMSPLYFRDIYELFIKGSYDVVVGSRYCPGGQTHDSFAKVLQSRLLNSVMSLVIGVNARDLSINFRMHHTSSLQDIEEIMPLKSKHFAVNQEIFLKLRLMKADKRLSVGETPIVFENRMEGKSKRRLFVFIPEYIQNIFRLSYYRLMRRGL